MSLHWWRACYTGGGLIQNWRRLSAQVMARACELFAMDLAKRAELMIGTAPRGKRTVKEVGSPPCVPPIFSSPEAFSPWLKEEQNRKSLACFFSLLSLPLLFPPSLHPPSPTVSHATLRHCA